MNRIWTSARMFETETLVGSVFKGNHRTEYQSVHSADETLLELLQFDLHTQVNFYKGQPEDKEIWLAGQKLVEAGHYASVADGTDIFHYIPCNPGFRNMLEELEKNIKNSRNWNGNKLYK